MTKDWNRFKSQIEVLYIREKKSLKEVRHQMHKEHDFFASTRAYRIKLDAWGFRKNRKLRDGTSTPPKSPSTILTIEEEPPLETHRESALPTPGINSPLVSPVHHRHENISRGQTSFILHRVSWSPSVWPVMDESSIGTTRDFDDSVAISLLDLSRDQPHEVLSLPISNGYVNNWDTLNEAIEKRNFPVIQDLLGSSEATGIRNEDLKDLLVSVILNEIKEPHEASCDIAKLLLRCGASPVSSDNFGMTPLHIAVRSLRILETLLESIATSNIDLPGVDPVNSNGNTPLLSLLTPFATARSDPDEIDIKPRIELLLNAGANPNHKSDVGFTAFRLALTIQQRAPLRDVMNLALFIQKGADVLSPQGKGESPLKIFLNTLFWLEQPGMETQWAQLTLLFLDGGADADTLIGEDTLLSFCVQKLLFDPVRNPQRTTAILKVMYRVCDLVELESWMLGQMRKMLHLLIRNLSCTPKEDGDTLVACIQTLVGRWAAKRLTGEVNVLFKFAMMVQNPSQIDASKIIRVLEIFLITGANPLRQDESLDRPIYVALRHFDGDLRVKIIRLLLKRSITAQDDVLARHALRDSTWFNGWKTACKTKAWNLGYEDNFLPHDLTCQQKNILVGTARSILADICIEHASAVYFQSASESNRESAKEQILDIIDGVPYKELEGIRVSLVDHILKVIFEKDDRAEADRNRIASDEIETLLQHSCTCGDSCQCFGCLSHPNNSTGRTQMQHLEHALAADEDVQNGDNDGSHDNPPAQPPPSAPASMSSVGHPSSTSGAVAPISQFVTTDISEMPRSPLDDVAITSALQKDGQRPKSPFSAGIPLNKLLGHVKGSDHRFWWCLETQCWHSSTKTTNLEEAKLHLIQHHKLLACTTGFCDNETPHFFRTALDFDRHVKAAYLALRGSIRIH